MTTPSNPRPSDVVVRRTPGGLMPLSSAPASGDPKAGAFALFKAGHNDVMELIRENLGDGGVDFSTLTGVAWPNSTSLSFSIETAEGPKAFREVEAVILRYRDGRVLWGSSYAESNGDPPVCISEDMRIGVGTPGGECAACPLSQWGSGRDEKGNTTRGKACSERRRLFLMVPWSLLPIHVNVPPTSLKPLRQYLSKLIGLGLPYYSVVTRLTLVKAQNANGTEYAEIAATMSGRLNDDEIRVFRSLNEQFDSAFKAQSVVPATPTPTPGQTAAGAATPTPTPTPGQTAAGAATPTPTPGQTAAGAATPPNVAAQAAAAGQDIGGDPDGQEDPVDNIPI